MLLIIESPQLLHHQARRSVAATHVILLTAARRVEAISFIHDCVQWSPKLGHELNTFNVAILAVSDHAIPKVSKNIKCPLVVHTSGTTSIQELKNPYRKGVFYPLQSFSKEKPVDFPKVPICIEVEEQQADATVTWSNIGYGPIGSTFKMNL